MKTSLGIWAFGAMATRFNPGGYKPELSGISTAQKVRTAVEGLGDLIDDYEFHYPQELSPDNLDEVRTALDGHGIYCIASGLHLDPRFAKGGFSSPDDATRARGARLTREAIDLAAEVGAHMIIWPGIEGYNYPFQTPYADSWARFIDGVGEAAEHAQTAASTVFLEHKNSEPAMKILMRNIGMTLHVIHTLRRQGIDNVKVNMDWQHLIMNGENLAEYAALLAADGLLGHQHANSGWGTFDDDNMVGATAFMETLELAVELRRAGYGNNGERLGFDLYPYTEDAVGAVKRSVLQWRFIDGVAATHRRRRAARGAAGEGRRPRLRARVRRARVPDASSASTSARPASRAIAISPDGEVLATRGGALPALDAAAGLGRAGSRGLVARRAGVPRAPARGRRSASPGRCTGSSCSTTHDRVLRPAILWNDQRTGAECAEIERRVGLERLIELTGNRALTGFTAPKLLWLRTHEPETYARIRHVLLPKDYVRFRLTGEHAIDAADASGTLLFDVARRRWSEEVCAALEIPLEWLPPAHESTEIAGRRRPGRGRARRRDRHARAGLGRARHVRRRLRGAARLRARPAGARARLLPRRARHLARDGRDAERGRLGGVAARVRSAPSSARSTRRPARWAPGAEGLLFAPYLAGERTPYADPDARGAFTGLSSCATTAVRSGARCSKASPTGCATRSSCSATLGVAAGRRPRLGRRRPQRRSGCGSSPRCSACRSSGRRRRKARRSAPRCSPACGRASSPTRTTPSRVASASRERIEPEPEWARRVRARATSATARSTPPSTNSATA